MEEKDYDYSPQPEKKQMVVSEEDKAVIASSCKWARFLAIVGFVMMGFAALSFLTVLLVISVAGIAVPMAAGYGQGAGTMMTVMMIICTLIMLIYFLPLFYLYRYASGGLKAVGADDAAMMTESLLNLKRCFKFIGILTIAVIALYVLLFVIMLAAGISGAFSEASGLLGV